MITKTRVFEYLKNRKRILDVGCGVGELMCRAPEKIEGIDIDKGKIEICKKAGLRAMEGNVLDLPYDDESFDCVHASHIIEHLTPKELHTALSEMDRVLQPAGLLIIRSPCFHRGFWLEIDHIRPYPPETILKHLKNYTLIKKGFKWKFPTKRILPERKSYYLILQKVGVKNQNKNS
jgi:ubiquinone/menaquinone biosynthesis C-methylase UbiE